ncbi:hypothetical protein KY284_009056 [Solanum tuberosum]|nr:hypothetical protein KY284_009056 [Solanum tuberosum]
MAYAAISSLMYTLNQLLKPNQSFVCPCCTQQHLESLCQNLSALQDFLDDTTTKDIETLKVVEKRIRNVVYKAEDRIDSSLRSIIVEDREVKRQKACKSFYEELLKVEQQAWVTISEEYNERQMLLELVTSITGRKQETIDDELMEIVYRGLKGRRFLIVIDDIWSTKAWDQMQRIFPNDDNKSRILLTTRLKYVADYVSCPDFPPHKGMKDEEREGYLKEAGDDYILPHLLNLRVILPI